MQVEIPYHAPTLNQWERMNRFVRHRHRDLVGTLLAAKMGFNPGMAPGRVRVSVKVVLAKRGRRQDGTPIKRARRYDNDNCVPARKAVLDALVRLGWLKNDSPAWCESRDLPCELADEAKVVVTLEPLSTEGVENALDK